MRVMSHILSSVVGGLFVALLAPAIAGAVFGLELLALPSTPSNQIDMSPGSLILFAIGMASGAYLLGGIPAFIAGLALPVLRRKCSNVVASVATGVMACALYLATFGAHLLTQARPMQSVSMVLFPAFLGTFVAAYVFTVRHTALE